MHSPVDGTAAVHGLSLKILISPAGRNNRRSQETHNQLIFSKKDQAYHFSTAFAGC
jgi:hypothetical protein